MGDLTYHSGARLNIEVAWARKSFYAILLRH